MAQMVELFNMKYRRLHFPKEALSPLHLFSGDPNMKKSTANTAGAMILLSDRTFWLGEKNPNISHD